jgi:hypothetical protein
VQDQLNCLAVHGHGRNHFARRNVPFLPHQYYHVYNRGAHRINIFRNDADYVFLLKLVKQQVEKCEISMIAYCLMHNHYHFLLRQLVDREFVKENFGSPEAYRKFVMDYVPQEKTQKKLRHYLFWD